MTSSIRFVFIVSFKHDETRRDETKRRKFDLSSNVDRALDNNLHSINDLKDFSSFLLVCRSPTSRIHRMISSRIVWDWRNALIKEMTFPSSISCLSLSYFIKKKPERTKELWRHQRRNKSKLTVKIDRIDEFSSIDFFLQKRIYKRRLKRSVTSKTISIVSMNNRVKKFFKLNRNTTNFVNRIIENVCQSNFLCFSIVFLFKFRFGFNQQNSVVLD